MINMAALVGEYEVILTRIALTSAVVSIAKPNPMRVVLIVSSVSGQTHNIGFRRFTPPEVADYTFSTNNTILEFNAILHGPLPSREMFANSQISGVISVLEVIALP